MQRFSSRVTNLLIASLVLTIGRAVTLPFITIYLVEHFQLAPDTVGLLLGASLALGIFTSLYGGYLVDKFNKKRLILLTIILFSATFFALPWIEHPAWVILTLALLHSAYSVYTIAVKACFADWLPVNERIKAFSANYTMVNVGWAIGPVMGVLVVGFGPQLPFIISGALALLVAIVLKFRINDADMLATERVSSESVPDLRQTFNILRHDKRLIYFTLGSLLGAMVFAQFSGYLSQYLITVFDAKFAYQVIGAVMTVNATIVIALQYLLSRRMNQQNLMRWLMIGTLFFIIGLLGFMVAQDSIPLWMLAMAIFSLGEIIVIPAEYLFIDFIAPANLKGSYYGVQNLGQLGGAINPVLCGFLLAYTVPEMMFYMLIIAATLGLVLFYRGYHLAK
ncbi:MULTISPECIES: MFS transporter [Yersinia pseudotuberculosis complex]|uniref:Transporter, major facilitator family n=1 Tax=Yersinia pseudotuberculosis serotype O:1b (strain IP 31758) TaxID=349747 RepID=A0A0U1R0N2_YERP3|nr:MULTISPECIES: MFS transporter [Yersinia pseudotuberculosis complex]ABS48686.1 transporter, major facilitator family [Yersinia pseudotuberculosis IP 31758]MCE4113005.1 MFS transporter [Yersinia pseudotuberculosis]MCF1162856.1 MFS transporter [Yersinia pseudotuberculosis]RYC28332.1 MFS transporter [Yersinia pseudotuberculosis]UFA62148.1 Major facilitator superfamily (MFS) protein [Yersinia pseudotuberculosis]